MILEKLAKALNDTQNRIEQEDERLNAIKSISEMLSEIDFTAEEVPIEDESRLSRLLVSLKGKPLAQNEIDLINEIVKN